VIKQRYKDQILHDVAHDLIPRAVDDALRERGMEAVDTPDVRDVSIEQGQPLTFTASFDTVPIFDPGELSTIAFRRASKAITDEAVQLALQRLRDRAARHEPVEGRGVDHGDTVVLDLERRDAGGKAEPHDGVSIELGAKANPPGLDEQLLGLEVGATKEFTIHHPADYPIGELANTDVSYRVTVKGLKRRVLPELDDEFAKDLGEFDTLDALKARVREDLEHEAKHAAEREDRAELMKQLAARVPFEVPASMVDREVDRRLEDFARRLIDQHVDPHQAGIDWNAFRESQRGVAREAVAAALVLDEAGRREALLPEPANRRERAHAIFSRLPKDSIIFVGTPIDEQRANLAIAQMLLLEAEDPDKDSLLYINSPGGSITAGMAIYHTMQFIK